MPSFHCEHEIGFSARSCRSASGRYPPLYAIMARVRTSFEADPIPKIVMAATNREILSGSMRPAVRDAAEVAHRRQPMQQWREGEGPKCRLGCAAARVARRAEADARRPKPTELRARPRPVTDRAAPGNADAPGVARAADVSVIPMVEAETSGIGLAART